MAYASALGILQLQEALPDILALLCETSDLPEREELALAVARIVPAYGYCWPTVRPRLLFAARIVPLNIRQSP